MQKLVKRKMHYETIMPVEAYECEDDPLSEDAEFWGMKGFSASIGFVVGVVFGPPAGFLAATAVECANHYGDLWDTMAEGEVERQNIEQENHDAMHNAVVDINNAMGDAVIDFVGSIDLDDPIVQLYGE